MQDGFIVGVGGGGAASGDQRVLCRPGGLAGEAEVVGQDIGELLVPLGVEPLEDFADGAVEIDPLPPRERVVGGLVGQRMAEQVLEVRRSLQGADQANDFEPVEVVLQVGRGVISLRPGMRGNRLRRPVISLARSGEPSVPPARHGRRGRDG